MLDNLDQDARIDRDVEHRVSSEVTNDYLANVQEVVIQLLGDL
jgi:hypothetical protein